MTSCAFLEWPDGLEPTGASWTAVSRLIAVARPDLLVTNEMPFGTWWASAGRFDADTAQRAVARHEQGLDALRALGVPAIISSRPVWAGDKLANEAFALEAGQVRPLHRKQYFPEEAGWFEATWFHGDGGFAVHDAAGLKVGVLLCTELMFNERARHYGRAGADLIAVPRASGRAHHKWVTAGAMAAIVAGSYVVSSNRIGESTGGTTFGGRGFAFAPGGLLLDETSNETPLMVIEIDTKTARRQKTEYPCYVAEISNG